MKMTNILNCRGHSQSSAEGKIHSIKSEHIRKREKSQISNLQLQFNKLKISKAKYTQNKQKV